MSGMKGQVIGKTLPNGFAGDYSRQPDDVIDTHALGGDQNILFGQALVYSNGKVVPFGATNVAADFVGIALTGIKSAVSYVNQNIGQYEPNDPVAVMKRGCCLVKCNNGNPALAGKVYVRIAENASIPTGVIGGFEAVADSTNTVELTNVQWKTGKDANGIAEVRILTCNKA